MVLLGLSGHLFNGFLLISGMYVTKLVGVMFICIFLLDLLSAIGVAGTFAGLIITTLVIGIIVILLIISRQPQNR